MKRKEIMEKFMEDMGCMKRHLMPRNLAKDMPKGISTHSQMGILALIYHEGPQTIKDLAKHFGMTSSAATQSVNSMTREALLLRKPNDDDRRKVEVHITTAGKKTFEQLKAKHTERMEEFFAPLTDEELLQMHKLHHKIIAHWTPIWQKKQ